MTGGDVAAAGHLRIRDSTSTVEALISPHAGALRRLRMRGVDLVEPTDAMDRPPGMAGAILAPWPNRVEDATWWQDGRMHALDVTEPELGHANHGLLSEHRFDIGRHDDASVELTAGIRRPPGYPFALEVAVRYEVSAVGVTVTTTVVNSGSDSAPVALGAHPYLRVGEASVPESRLALDVTHAYRLDGRNIPRERFAVGGTAWDLRGPTPVADAPGHATFVREHGEGVLRHRLLAQDGGVVELWADPDYRWTQLYRAEGFPAAAGPRTAVAVEPMTAPPNALRSGEGLRWLAPGERWCVSWGITGALSGVPGTEARRAHPVVPTEVA
jgi:aldose 1-epimerase